MKRVNHLFTKVFCYAGALFIMLASASCNSFEDHTPHSSGEQLDRLIGEVDNLAARSRKSGVQIVDSLYHKLSRPDTEDLCDKYLLESYYLQNDYPREEQYADSALQLIQSRGLENKLAPLYGRACLYKGKALLQQQKYNEAYICYCEGIKAIRSTHDTFQFSQFNGKLGTVCYEQGDYLDAANYYRKCVQEKQKYPPDKNNFSVFFEQQANLDNIGLCYSKSGMPDSAIYYFHKALDYINTYSPLLNYAGGRKTFIEAARGVIYGNLGTAYFNKGELKIAEAFYNKSISMNNREGYEIEDARLTQLKLATLYLKTSRINEAGTMLQQYKAVVDTNGYIAPQWYKLEAEYDNMQNKPGEAYHYLNIYAKKLDSVEAAHKKFISIDFNRAYENINEQSSFVTLKKEDENQNAESVIAVFFLAMMIGIAVFVSKNNKQLKELNQKSIIQNNKMQQTLDALEQSHRENTRMMEVLTHDLREPLTTISNMANLLNKEEVSKETQREFLSLIQTSSSAMLDIISDVLVSQLNSEKK